jgi:uncharacterized membrane protein YcaP (DUF421 family)
MSDVVYFYSGWEPIARVVIVGVLMYITLVVILRITGSRSLASMSAFDFIVTVAIGSAFGRAITAKGVALAEAVAAFLVLIMLQYLIASFQNRWSSFMGVVTNPPALLYFRGQYLRDAMRKQRVTEAELHAAIRKKQRGSMTDVEAVILESSGEFSVISSMGDHSAFGEAVERQIPRRPAGDPNR